MSYIVSGSYFESCNCDAICPCRMVGGVAGGRSTNGICFGVLGWLVEDGHSDGVRLDGLGAAMTIRYDDDEPGSPWTLKLHVDERGDEQQREALASILLGGWAARRSSSCRGCESRARSRPARSSHRRDAPRL